MSDLTREVIEFWQLFCYRQRLPGNLMMIGETLIEEDPEHWSQRSMADLWTNAQATLDDQK